MRTQPGHRHWSKAPGAAEQQRSSLFRRMFRGLGWLSAGPVEWAGLRGISRSASLIGELSAIMRSASRRDRDLGPNREGGVDLNAATLCDGLSAAELERHWKVRRRQTALTAYATFALGCLFLLAWVYEASSLPWIAPRLVLALKSLPFCALFFLLAFYHALLNFQIRVGHLASWREYLLCSEPFWPR
jgi:hypothetical protein